MDAIRTRGLTKRYGSTVALEGLDLVVPEGVVYGFLGPNGAGKTTALRLLAGLLRPTRGSATVLGLDAQRDRVAVQGRIGYLPGEVSLYEDLTGAENLDFLGALHRLPAGRRAGLLDRFEMPRAVLRRKVRTYSRGMLQKLGLVAAFQHDAPLFVLDEPTAGLDPLMRAVLVEWIEEEAERGKTVLLSSHVVSEVERSCERVAMIREGRLIFQGLLSDVRARALSRLDVVFARPVELDWSAVAGVSGVQGTSRHHIVSFRGKPGPLLRMLEGLPVEDLTVGGASLEETFLELYRGETG